MKPIIREYSLIALLCIVGMAGYLYFRTYKQDILAYSLDAVGERLVALVDDEAHAGAIAELYDRFKRRVLNHEVSPEQVEYVAANVLNLSNSGSRLTPEQARLVLEFSTEVEALPMPSPGADSSAELPRMPVIRKPHKAPPPPDPEAMKALGERIQTMIAFNAEVKKMVDDGRRPQEAPMAEHVRFHFKDGLHVSVDSALVVHLNHRRDMDRLAREMHELERKRMVVVERDMAEHIRAEQERVRQQLEAVAKMREELPNKEIHAAVLGSLEALKRLEVMGYEPLIDVDSLEAAIEVQLKGIEKQIEKAVEEAVKGAAEGAAGIHVGEG